MGISIKEAIDLLPHAIFLGAQGAVLSKINSLLSSGKNVLLYGPKGSGKTTILKKIPTLYLDISNLNGDDLLTALGSSHLTKFGTEYTSIVLDGAESFDWKSYRTVLRTLKSSAYPIVLVTSDVLKIPNSVRNSCIAVSMDTLDDESAIEFSRILSADVSSSRALEIWRSCKGNIGSFTTNLLYDNISPEIITKTYNTRQAAELLINSKDRNFVFKVLHRLSEPFSWLIGWTRHNAVRAYRGEELNRVLEVISFIDIFKYKTRKEYVLSLLAYGVPPSKRRVIVSFPDLLRKKKTPVAKKKKKIKKEKKKIKRDEVFDAFDL